MKRSFALLAKVALVIALSLILAGCSTGGKGVETAPKAGGTLVYGESAELDSLDPALNQESVGMQVNREIFDGLVDYDPVTLKTIPAVAENWAISNDAKMVTFHLRKGVKFHNGREVTADDFVYSWTRALDPSTNSPVSYVLLPILGAEEFNGGKSKSVEGLKAKDKYTLEVKLSYSFADFPNTLVHTAASVVPKEEVKKWGLKFSEHPVGCGPYAFVRWKKQQEVTVERNDAYYGKKGNVEKITVKFFGNPESAYKEFQAGALDFVPNVPAGQLEAAKMELGKNFISKPIMSFYYYGFNVNKKPFSNLDLRKAIAYSTDPKAAVDSVLEGNAEVATGIVPPGMVGYSQPKTEITYDSRKTEEFLKAAKVKIPYTTTLFYNTGGNSDRFGQAIQARMREAKANIDLKGMEFGTYMDQVSKGNLSFFTLNWIADYPSPDNFLFSLFDSSVAGDTNSTFYSNEEVDALLKKARSELDFSKRMDIYRQAEEKVLSDSPVIPLYWAKSAYAFQDKVGGAFVDAMSFVPLEKLWIK